MKNKKLLSLMLVGVALLGFTVGGVTEANTDVMTKLIDKAYTTIGATGYNTKNELLNNIDGAIDAKLTETVNPLLDQKAMLVEAALQSYFDAKLDEAIGDVSEIDAELEAIANEIINRYKEEIDRAFKK